MAAKVLLVGKGTKSSTCLSERLRKCGCDCHVATSHKDAQELFHKRRFDLVLSELGLQDGTALQLIPLLVNSGASLFYSLAVEDSCWWLPAVRHGRNCFGEPAFRPSAFSRVLDELLQEIQSGTPAIAVTPPRASLEAGTPVVLGFPVDATKPPQVKPARATHWKRPGRKLAG